MYTFITYYLYIKVRSDMDITELLTRIFVINEITCPVTRQKEKDGQWSSFQVMNLILFGCEGSRVNLTIFGENSGTLHK
jgi:hypothetical protein